MRGHAASARWMLLTGGIFFQPVVVAAQYDRGHAVSYATQWAFTGTQEAPPNNLDPDKSSVLADHVNSPQFTWHYYSPILTLPGSLAFSIYQRGIDEGSRKILGNLMGALSPPCCSAMSPAHLAQIAVWAYTPIILCNGCPITKRTINLVHNAISRSSDYRDANQDVEKLKAIGNGPAK